MQPAQDSPIIMLTIKKSPSKNTLLDFVKFEYKSFKVEKMRKIMKLYVVLAKFWRISLFLTDDANAKLYVKINCQVERNVRKFSNVELRISLICKFF